MDVLTVEFGYKGRDPFKERLEFEAAHKAGGKAIESAKTLAFLMGYRGTNITKILKKTINISKVTDAMKKLGLSAEDRKGLIKHATMYPEMIALGQCRAGKFLTTPFVSEISVKYDEWLELNRVFCSVTKCDYQRFIAVALTVWNGIKNFSRILSQTEMNLLKSEMRAAYQTVAKVADGEGDDDEPSEQVVLQAQSTPKQVPEPKASPKLEKKNQKALQEQPD